MPNKKNAEWRKAKINEIEGGQGINEIHIKQSVDVLNSVIEDLEYSIDKTARASKWLSTVLVIATVVMALVAAANLYVTISHGANNVPKISSELRK